jgi:hypothetical protein
MNNTLPFAKLTCLFTIACLAFAPIVRAVDPPPDGGYSNQNTAEGEDALFSLTAGFFNTTVGYNALFHDTSGSLNTALGAQALLVNTRGMSNTASGSQALLSNTTGDNNTASGANALLDNSSGNNNTASGASALLLNMTGASNTASGGDALSNNTTGSGNTATGRGALSNNSTGNNNIAVGFSAGRALTTGSNNIDIGNRGATGESNTIRIGAVGTHTATYVAGISGATVSGGVAVVVDADGHLGTMTSSRRYKDEIKPMDKASEAILSLQPVTFRYKHDLDRKSIPQFGLVAEQVEKVNPDLVARDKEGKPYSVRYEAVNAMLLNEFLKEHRKSEQQDRKIEKQEAMIMEQQREINALAQVVREQAAQIRTVSAQLENNEATPRLIASRR